MSMQNYSVYKIGTSRKVFEVYMNYYINSNKQPENKGGNYEVHKQNCQYYLNYTNGNNFILLGWFNTSIEAIRYAKSRFPSYASSIDGCAYCCPKNNNG
jgi:hypothetical protein